MNKYIKFDIENAKSYMKVALMNSMNDIDIGNETSIDLGRNISWNLRRFMKNLKCKLLLISNLQIKKIWIKAFIYKESII